MRSRPASDGFAVCRVGRLGRCHVFEGWKPVQSSVFNRFQDGRNGRNIVTLQEKRQAYLPKMNGWLGRDILGFETCRGNS